MPENKSKYTFERTELRVLQNMCEGDNEKFLNYLADMVGGLTEKNQKLENENSRLKSELAERDD
jgi:cell division septum initiation protein DivIVA